MTNMAPRLRKVALTAHVALSVGWLGAVVSFLALAIAGLVSQDVQVVRGAYVAMELVAYFVLVPLALFSLLTGLIQSLGTEWGLLRHYWVLAKLLLTVFATIVLLLQMEAIVYLAETAGRTALSSADLREARISLVVHAGGGLLILLIAVTLSIYKPRGITGYGKRKSHEQRKGSRP